MTYRRVCAVAAVAATAPRIAQYAKRSTCSQKETYRVDQVGTWRRWWQKQCRLLSAKKEPYMYEQRPIKDTNCRAKETIYGGKNCVNGLSRKESYVCARRDISIRPQGTPERTRYCCNSASKETFVRGRLRKESYICAQRDILLRPKEIISQTKRRT